MSKRVMKLILSREEIGNQLFQFIVNRIDSDVSLPRCAGIVLEIKKVTPINKWGGAIKA